MDPSPVGRGRPIQADGPTRRWSRAAPWLAAAAAVSLGAFFAGIALAVGATLVTNQTVIALGAIPGRWRWVFSLPPLGAVVVALMLVAAIALWAGRRRSVIGRLYFSLLTIAGLIGVANLFRLGVVGLWRS